MEEFLGILMVLLAIAFPLAVSWAMTQSWKETQKEKPFIVRLIDNLAKEAPEEPDEPSPYQGEEWTSSAPTRTVEGPLASEDSDSEGLSITMRGASSAPTAPDCDAHGHRATP